MVGAFPSDVQPISVETIVVLHSDTKHIIKMINMKQMTVPMTAGVALQCENSKCGNVAYVALRMNRKCANDSHLALQEWTNHCANGCHIWDGAAEDVVINHCASVCHVWDGAAEDVVVNQCANVCHVWDVAAEYVVAPAQSCWKVDEATPEAVAITLSGVTAAVAVEVCPLRSCLPFTLL